MDPLIVRNRTELANALANITLGIDDLVSTAQAAGVFILPPDDIQIEGVFLIEANVGNITTTTTTPVGNTTTTDTIGAVTTTRTETRSGSNNETATPAGRTVTHNENGGDDITTEREYEAVTEE